MLGSKIKECKPSRSDLKSWQRHRNEFLYEAWYSIVLLRPKNKVNLLTQSAAKWICMGKWSVSCGGVYFHHVFVLARVSGGFNDHLLANSSVEYSKMTFFKGGGGKIK